MSDWTPDFGTLGRPAPAWAKDRPRRILLLGDFSGAASRGRLEGGAELAARKPVAVEFDTLDAALQRLQPRLSVPLGEGGTPVELAFDDLDAFHPDALFDRCELFAAVGGLRQRLQNASTFAKAAAQVQGWAGSGTGTPRRASRAARRSRSRGATLAADASRSDFARLVGLPPSQETPQAGTGIEQLLRDVVAPFVQPAADPRRETLTAAVDAALSDAMRALLQHAEFQNLEALWRGLDLLLRRIETGAQLSVHILDITAEEFAADLSAHGDLCDSALHALLVDKPGSEKNGGYALVCGLFQFEVTPPQVELLGRAAQVAQQAGAVLVAGIEPQPFLDAKAPVHALVGTSWKALKALPAAAHLMLAAPRFMLRNPYGRRSDPIERFAFEEFVNADGLRALLWGHPALLVAALLAGPGAGRTTVVRELPFHHVVDADGDQVALPCTERFLRTDAAAMLLRVGVVPVVAHKGANEVHLGGLAAVAGNSVSLGQPPAPRVGRGGVQVGVGVGAGGVSVGVTARAASRPAAAPAADERGDAAAPEAPADAGAGAAADAGSGSSELDDLLASLGQSQDAQAEAASAEPASADAVDDDLAALLASLG